MIIAKLERLVWNTDRLQRAEERMAARGLFKASAFVRKVAKQNFIGKSKKKRKKTTKKRKVQSPTGKLRQSILFFVDRDRRQAVVGPSAKIVGDSGAAHEFGGQYKGGHFEKRAFMGPALEKSSDRIAGFFAGEFQ